MMADPVRETETKTSVIMSKLDELMGIMEQTDTSLGNLVGHDGCDDEDRPLQSVILYRIETQIDDLLVIARRSKNKVNEIC